MLLAAEAGYEGEAAVAVIAHIMRQQRLSPYAATLAARSQHTTLHVSSLPRVPLPVDVFRHDACFPWDVP